MTAQQRLTADERRGQILEAALDVFAEKGFNGARIKEIAHKAGISETLIYQHFDSKEALHETALSHLFAGHPLESDMRVPLEQGDDKALFKAMALHMLTHAKEDPRIVRLFLYRALEECSSPKLSKIEKGSHEAMLVEYIQTRINDGTFAPGNPVFMCKLFHYALFMAAADKQLGLMGPSDELSDDELAENLAQYMLNGFLKR